MQRKHDWFWFGFPLVEKVAQVLSQSVVMQNQSKHKITFNTQLTLHSSALSLVLISSIISCHLYYMENLDAVH